MKKKPSITFQLEPALKKKVDKRARDLGVSAAGLIRMLIIKEVSNE